MVVVVGGNVLHHVKREGNCPGAGNVLGDMSGGNISTGKCPASPCRRLVLREFIRPKTSSLSSLADSEPCLETSFSTWPLSVPLPPAGRLSRHRGRISCISHRLSTEYAMSVLIDDGASCRCASISTGCMSSGHLTTHGVQFST